MVALIERLIGKGIQLAIHDPYVTSSRLIGANREYIEREVPHIWELMRGSTREVLEVSEAIIIGNSAGEFREIQGHLRPDQPVVDLVRAFGARLSDGTQYQGICW
jgi:GDP-mannose 6-dehydrogenase